MRNVCPKCQIEMQVEKNEVPVIHFTDNNRDKGIDFMVWGDLWKCPTCKNEIISGFGKMIMEYELPQGYCIPEEFVEIKR